MRLYGIIFVMENISIVNEILKQSGIFAKNIVKSSSGFTNQVFFADDYVVKFTNDSLIKEQLEKEISIYKNIKLDFIPKLISFGELDNYKYLIITKLKGKPLYSIWHTLDKSIKLDIIHKIINIIKEFNRQDSKFLCKEYVYFDWEEYITEQLLTKTKTLKEMGFDVQFLEEIINNKFPILFKNNTFGLIYNDAHFDNFIYDNGKVYLIDFDRVIVAPLDYEMLIFKTMCDTPDKFASEQDYLNCKIEDYDWLYEIFMASYPELFSIPFVSERIKLYQFNYLMKQALECKNNDWINQLLNNLKSDF